MPYTSMLFVNIIITLAYIFGIAVEGDFRYINLSFFDR